MGAWCIVDPTNCTVKCIAFRATGQHQWVGSASVGVFPACTYNAQHPDAPWPKPSCCGSQPASPPPAPPPPSPPPPASTPASSGVQQGPVGAGGPQSPLGKGGAQGPITGPKEPDPCAPAMSQRSDSDQLGFTTEKHLNMPRTGEFSSVRHGNTAGLTAEPPVTGTPAYSKAPDIRTNADGMITVADLPTGPGYLVFHSSDINEFGLRGDSIHPEGAWPAAISHNTLLIHVGARSPNTTGDDARNYLAVGLPSARPEAGGKPRNGFYWDYDPDTKVYSLIATNGLSVSERGARVAFYNAVTIGGYSDAERDLMATETSVAAGTIIWNTDDEVFQYWDGDSWEVFGGGGSGDVVGPASATDNAIARFDGTTGKLIQESGVYINDVTAGIAAIRTANGNNLHLRTQDTLSSTPTDDIYIDPGVGDSTNEGTISIGTTQAQSVSIGRSGKNTAIGGTLSSGAHTKTQGTIGTLVSREIHTKSASAADVNDVTIAQDGRTTDTTAKNFDFTITASVGYTFDLEVRFWVHATAGGMTDPLADRFATYKAKGTIDGVSGTVSIDWSSEVDSGSIMTVTPPALAASTTLRVAVAGVAGSGTMTYDSHCILKLGGPCNG